MMGGLMAIGGGELRDRPYPLLKKFVSGLGKKTEIVEVILAAVRNNDKDEIRKDYSEAFRSLGKKRIGFIEVNRSSEANDPEWVDRINRADAVYFTGGDQKRLLQKLSKSLLLETVNRNFKTNGLLIGGTSAGAAALSEITILNGKSESALTGHDITVVEGFGFLKETIIDTHFIERGRISRLIRAVCSHPDFLGIGLGARAAIMVRDNILEVSGPDPVIILDGKKFGYNKLRQVKDCLHLTMENAILHCLSNRDRFDLKKRKYLRK